VDTVNKNNRKRRPFFLRRVVVWRDLADVDQAM